MFSLTNKSLIQIAIISVFSSVLITLFLLFNPFDDYDPLYVSGKTLYIKSYEPLIVKEYGYLDLDNSQKIIIAPEDRSLAILNIEITNAASTEIRIISNEKSSEFMSKDGFTYTPLNPASISKNAKIKDQDLSYPIWGSFTLNNLEKAEGFLLFIVKDSFKPNKFSWVSSDRVLISFD